MADINKTAYHPNLIHEIYFNEKYHTYTDNFNQKYISCTTFFKKFTPEFDTVAMSEQCSKSDNKKYSGRDPVEIRKEWKIEGERGSTEGTNTHEYAESLFDKWDKKPAPISDRCKLLFKQVEISHKRLLSKFQYIGSEIIVFSPGLGVAGMIDLLMYDPETKTIIIIDWKQNKEITSFNCFQSFKKPIDHLQETDLNKYSLQLSMYQYILEKEHYFLKAENYKRIIIHITPENAKIIKLEYFDYEIKELLNIC